MASLQIAVDPRRRYTEEQVAELVKCAEDFGYFLKYWKFRNQESGEVQILGEQLWPGQFNFVEAVVNEKFLFALKARKLGYTTIECAYDAWVARFRDKNARVHLFSRREKAAHELLGAVKFGLKRLPDWMKLPIGSVDTKDSFSLNAGEDDERLMIAYPADEETAVEATCTHGHVDEWARMGNPRAVWQAIEPSMAGSCHIITTGRGPVNWSSLYWIKTMAGDTPFLAFFQDALKRPDRNEAWLAEKKKGMDEIQFRQEYAMTWEDALYGGGDYVFSHEQLEDAQEDAVGETLAEDGRKYVKAWDIGRHQDAAVGTVIDVTDDVEQVVFYERLRGAPYPWLQQRITSIHESYPGPTVIEANGPGEAVMENLEISEYELIKWTTSKKSKAKIISGLKLAFQNQTLRYSKEEWPQLDAELRSYTIPDDEIVQDSVISLAICHEHSAEAWVTGRARKVLTWG